MVKFAGFGLTFWILAATLEASAIAPIRNLQLPRVQNELIVGIRPGFVPTDLSTLANELKADIIDHFQASQALLLRFNGLGDERADLGAIARKLAESELVAYVEANHLVRANVSDPRFSEQYALKNVGQSNGLAGMDISAESAWAETTGDRRVLVAVVDTGIDYDHPDLKANIWSNPGETGVDSQGNDKRTNGIDDDGNGFIDDFQGWDFVSNDNDPRDDNGHSHGSHCAGVIGAETQNGIGIAGINWQVSLVAVKFLDARGSGSLANAIKAVEYASKIGARISSNSWGGGGFSQALEAAIINAQTRGVLFVAAAGNDAVDTDDSPHYPSAYTTENIIAVAAIDRSGKLADFSNFGRRSVDIAAPGVNILSTTKGGTYAQLSGTSMAAPHVSGVAALIWARHPELSVSEVKARILNSSVVTESVVAKTLTNGRLNAGMAVEHDIIPPNAVSQAAILGRFRQALEMQWRQAGDDGESGVAHAYEVRHSVQPILDEQDWRRANQLEVEIINSQEIPLDVIRARLSGFAFNDSGFLSIRARDNVGNMGAIGEPVEFGLSPVEVVGKYRPEERQELMLNGSWGVEETANRRSLVFSDSPAGKYSPNVDAAILLPMQKTQGTGYALSFDTAADLERGYDFGRVEVQINGQGPWILIKRFTDKFDWRSVYLQLDSYVAGSNSFQIRFRMVSDHEFEEQGWLIDEITVIKDE